MEATKCVKFQSATYTGFKVGIFRISPIHIRLIKTDLKIIVYVQNFPIFNKKFWNIYTAIYRLSFYHFQFSSIKVDVFYHWSAILQYFSVTTYIEFTPLTPLRPP